MGADFDPLDDIFADEAVKNSRAVGKFQPKAKFRPNKKKESAATVVTTSQAVKTIASTQSETASPSERCSDVVPNDNGVGHASMERSVGENSDLVSGLEASGDFLPHTSGDKESTLPPSETVALNVTNLRDAGGEHAIPAHSSVEDLSDTCKVNKVPTYRGLSEYIDSYNAEPIVPSSDGRDHMCDVELRTEEMDAIDSINMTELPTKSVHKKGKFQPKPKKQMHKEICEASKSVSYSLGLQSVPPETNYTEKDSVHTFQQDDILDLSTLGFAHNSATETTSEIPINEESINVMGMGQMGQLDSDIHEEGVLKIPTKLVSRRATAGSSDVPTASDPSLHQQEASPPSQEHQTGRSLRPRKSTTNFYELMDEDEYEVPASVEFSEECPLSSAIEEENINNEEFQVESELHEKMSKRKSEKTCEDKEKPARNRKKAKEAGAGAKPKKFSHSTRRRRVDKVLLETPEDEIDYHKVPLRDLILLADHKERQMKKDEAAAGAPATKQSNGNSSGIYNEDETFKSKQGGEYNDEQGSPMAEDTTVYFNYQTYMDKTPSTRWSKQDTELFYEAVRQFGTDLSMIQQLFPDRTRRQVKLKYKKEERQHPLRLRDALTNRTKDHSHFEKVIEHLKKIAAEEKQNADEDNSIDLTGNEVEDEGTSNADDGESKGAEDGEPKGEHNQEEENDDVANDFIEVQSPLKPDDDDDDLFRWSQYKSNA